MTVIHNSCEYCFVSARFEVEILVFFSKMSGKFAAYQFRFHSQVKVLVRAFPLPQFSTLQCKLRVVYNWFQLHVHCVR